VQALANGMSMKAIDVIRKLMQMGQMVNMNSVLDLDTASLVATEFQYEVKNVEFKEDKLIEAEPADRPEDLLPRPPVVTIMGHVDHGKTSLLDALREANVAAGEAGGITQHIGAYTVEKNGHKITFIDTPGHEAFTVMRARGANVTDIVILVVAADDGVMPQTREALSHAKAAGVPIIVAMNKIDKPQANPEKLKQQLAELDLLAEEWGGQTMFVPVSAIKRTNLDKLLESILLQAEVLDLKGNQKVRANGTVLEARLERGRGPVVSVLVRRGTLRVGDPIVSGANCGKVKAMMDHTGRMVKEVPPGMAAEILGFESVPNAGERFDSPATDIDARAIAENRGLKAKAQAAATASGKVSLDDLFAKIQAGAVKELPLILKADVFGSAEAIRDSLVKLSNDKVKVKVIHTAPGGITESDVLLATASKAIILGFNVRPETKARQVAEAQHIEIKCYNIIYELIDDVKQSMVGLLDKKKVEKFLGRAEVRQPFTVPKIGTIAGSAVIDGKLIRGANVRLLRDSRIIWDGKMSSLRRFKDDAKEVATGYECGIGLENYNDIKAGDIIEAYMIEMITPDMNS
jgi:translation initiation factor IF-2